MIAVGVIVAGVASWAVTPVVEIARQRTIDQRTVAAMRSEVGRLPHRHAEVDVPRPRAATDRVVAV